MSCGEAGLHDLICVIGCQHIWVWSEFQATEMSFERSKYNCL